MRCSAFFLFQPVAGRLPFFSHSSRLSAIPFFLFSLPIGNPPYLFSLSFARTFRNFFLSPFPPHAAAFFLLSLKCPHRPQLSFLLSLPPHATFFLPSLKCPHRPQLSFLLSLPPHATFFLLSLEGRGGRVSRVRTQKALGGLLLWMGR